jgi:hypothetical protein
MAIDPFQDLRAHAEVAGGIPDMRALLHGLGRSSVAADVRRNVAINARSARRRREGLADGASAGCGAVKRAAFALSMRMNRPRLAAAHLRKPLRCDAHRVPDCFHITAGFVEPCPTSQTTHPHAQ